MAENIEVKRGSLYFIGTGDDRKKEMEATAEIVKQRDIDLAYGVSIPRKAELLVDRFGSAELALECVKYCQERLGKIILSKYTLHSKMIEENNEIIKSLEDLIAIEKKKSNGNIQ